MMTEPQYIVDGFPLASVSLGRDDNGRHFLTLTVDDGDGQPAYATRADISAGMQPGDVVMAMNLILASVNVSPLVAP